MCGNSMRSDILPALQEYIAIPALSEDFDADWAAHSAFGERIAHGMLVLSYAVGLVGFDPERVMALRRISDAVRSGSGLGWHEHDGDEPDRRERVRRGPVGELRAQQGLGAADLLRVNTRGDAEIARAPLCEPHVVRPHAEPIAARREPHRRPKA